VAFRIGILITLSIESSVTDILDYSSPVIFEAKNLSDWLSIAALSARRLSVYWTKSF
jgi:hypothetical protein